MLGRTVVIAAALVLLFAPAASAQQQVTATSMNFSSEAGQTDPTEGIARGDGSYMFVRPEYCHGGPGLNPDEGEVVATLEIESWPEWVELTPPAETFTWTPPQVHPTQEEKCTQEEWQFNFKITSNAPYGEQGTVDVKVIVTNGDTGTYQDVAQEWTESIPVAVKQQEVDPITGKAPGEEDNGTSDPNVDANAEESPAPLPMVGILALVGLAALRRRD